MTFLPKPASAEYLCALRLCTDGDGRNDSWGAQDRGDPGFCIQYRMLCAPNTGPSRSALLKGAAAGRAQGGQRTCFSSTHHAAPSPRGLSVTLFEDQPTSSASLSGGCFRRVYKWAPASARALRPQATHAELPTPAHRGKVRGMGAQPMFAERMSEMPAPPSLRPRSTVVALSLFYAACLQLPGKVRLCLKNRAYKASDCPTHFLQGCFFFPASPLLLCAPCFCAPNIKDSTPAPHPQQGQDKGGARQVLYAQILKRHSCSRPWAQA